MKTEQAKTLLDLARRIIADQAAGLKQAPDRLEWAKAILSANALWRQPA